ncbi:transmembrane protein 154 isoform X2 [Antechinus flavipes]|uniref:transmembrane protein 154 isoform X2 n=1 Tax=Antechinus flavipes TaxID=38775 RepID=UPI002235832D|nr:transmembrane protein 154 isoform X2 [Antechinus flavipes]
MPERGQGNLRAPGFLLIFSLLLGKHRGFATDSEYSGEGSFSKEEIIPTNEVELTSITEQGEDDSSPGNSFQIPTTSPSPVSESVLSPEFLLMVGVPLVLLLLLSLLVVFFVRYSKRTKSKPVPSSQGSQSALQSYELGSENIKSPIFEEDTPSVMEIEMEDLDKWMNSINRNAECECLPTVREEEKESNHNAR